MEKIAIIRFAEVRKVFGKDILVCMYCGKNTKRIVER